MFKWHVNAAAGKGRPCAQDFTKLTNGVVASLRDFHISARRAEDERDVPQLVRPTQPSSRTERSEHVGREIQGLSVRAAMSPGLTIRYLDLSNQAPTSSPPPAKLLTRVVTERSGQNYVPGSARRGIGGRGRGGGGVGYAGRGSGGGGVGAGAGRGGRGGRVARARPRLRRRPLLPEKPLVNAVGRVMPEEPLKQLLQRSQRKQVELDAYEPFVADKYADQLEYGHGIEDLGPLTVPRPVDRRDPKKLAERLLAGEVLRFYDANEKGNTIHNARVMALAKFDEELRGRKDHQPSPKDITRERQHVSFNVRRLRDTQAKLVDGKYNTEVFGGDQQPPLPALKGLAKTLALNGTYRAGDEAAVMKKISELLPVHKAAGGPVQPRR